MAIPVESPCFGCVGKNNEKAPCCWNITLFISKEDKINLARFRSYGIPEIPSQKVKNGQLVELGTKFLINNRACPLLNTETGECTVEYDDKPFNCGLVLPLIDPDCTESRYQQAIPTNSL